MKTIKIKDKIYKIVKVSPEKKLFCEGCYFFMSPKLLPKKLYSGMCHEILKAESASNIGKNVDCYSGYIYKELK